MTPEAADYLEKAQTDLADARKVAGIGLARVAARLAYYAAFHAAEALLVQRLGKVGKTHSGVRAQFASLLKDEPDAGRAMLAFLARAYAYKQSGDYAVGRDASITPIQAEKAVEGAEQFVERIAAMIGSSTE